MVLMRGISGAGTFLDELMHATVCQCCGLPMRVCSAQNPNTCADCESLTFNHSPADPAKTCAPQPASPAPTPSLPKAVEFTCEIVVNDGVHGLTAQPRPAMHADAASDQRQQ